MDRPRRARESPLFRLVDTHLEKLLRVWPCRFQKLHCAVRPVVERVARLRQVRAFRRGSRLGRSSISYTSDASGADQIWTSRVEFSAAAPVLKDERQLRFDKPVDMSKWSPDGHRIAFER